MLANVRQNMTRDLPTVGRFRAHDRKLTIVAGGPSIKDTVDKSLDGVIVAVNGSLGFLEGQGIRAWGCGVCDANEHLVDIVPAVDGVWYFLASSCHPKLFDGLHGKRVVTWHVSGIPGLEEALPGKMLIGGGTTMGLRWINLGYVMGFRKFEIHGLDSSFRDGETHGYKDRPKPHRYEVEGYETNLAFHRQAMDFLEVMKTFGDDITVDLKGDGLLQHMWGRYGSA